MKNVKCYNCDNAAITLCSPLPKGPDSIGTSCGQAICDSCGWASNHKITQCINCAYADAVNDGDDYMLVDIYQYIKELGVKKKV